jgi:hypothetical protein
MACGIALGARVDSSTVVGDFLRQKEINVTVSLSHSRVTDQAHANYPPDLLPRTARW